MRRQDLHCMNIVICSEEDLELRYGKEMAGIGVIVNGTTFEFVKKTKRKRATENRIVYRGEEAISRELKNGCCSIRYVYDPNDNILTFFEKAMEELGLAILSINAEIAERSVPHDI